jgi:hypothetical protein
VSVTWLSSSPASFGVVRVVAHSHSSLGRAKTGYAVQKQGQRGVRCAWCVSLGSTMSGVKGADDGSEEKEYISAWEVAS